MRNNSDGEQDKAGGQEWKHTCVIPSTWEAEARRSGVQFQSRLHSKFKANLSYVRIPSSHPVVVDFFINLTQTTVIWEEGASTEEMFPSDWPTGNSVRHFLD